MAGGSAGTLVRDWRVRRRRSQMDLALEVGVSPRHLSFVETGRSKASPELLLALAEHLEVPLRERNLILLAGHDPYPGLVIDRYWNIVLANRAAEQFLTGWPDHVIGPERNVFRISLHQCGGARRLADSARWGRAGPAHQFRRSSPIDEHHGHFRFAWQLVAADGSVALPGLDVGHVREDGQLAQIVGFFGDVAAG